MAMSGVLIDDTVLDVYKAFKKRNSGGRLLILKMDNDKDPKRVVIAEQMEKTKNFSDDYDAFIEKMKEIQSSGGCCYCIFNFEVDAELGETKIMFITWVPEETKTKFKMIYTATKESLSNKIDYHSKIQANDMGDLERDTLYQECMKHDRK